MSDRRVQNVPWMNRAPGSNWTHARPEEPQQQMPLSSRQLQQHVASQRLQLEEQRFNRQLRMDEHKTAIESDRLTLDQMKFFTEQEQQGRAEEDTRRAMHEAALATQELATVGRNWRDPDWEIKVAEIQAKYPMAEMNERFAKQLDTYRGIHTKFLERQNEVIAKFQERYHAPPVLNEDGVTINKRESMKIVEQHEKALADAELAKRQPVGRVFEKDTDAFEYEKENPGTTFRFNSEGKMVAVDNRPNAVETEIVRDEFGKEISRTATRGRGNTPEQQPPPPAAPPVTVAATAKDKYPRAASVEEFEALKSGVTFIGPDGRRYRKP